MLKYKAASENKATVFQHIPEAIAGGDEALGGVRVT